MGEQFSVKIVRYELLQIYCALAEVAESVMDSKSAAEVSGIEKAIISFEFILSTVIWCEVLNKANSVSKNLQLSNINIDIAVSQMNSLIAFMNKFRKSGFAKCLDSAKEIVLALYLDDNKLFDKWQNNGKRIKRQCHFFDKINSVVSTTTFVSAEKKLEVEVFNCMLDKFISSTNERFHALKLFHSNFEVIFYLMDKNYLSKLPQNNLKAICLIL